jgi:hypothetical protein
MPQGTGFGRAARDGRHILAGAFEAKHVDGQLSATFTHPKAL